MAIESQQRNKRKCKASRTKFPGIVSDARVLGVTRQHLFEVLIGNRRSPLLQRYRELKTKAA